MARIGIGRYTRWRIEGLTSRLDSHSEKHENIFSHHVTKPSAILNLTSILLTPAINNFRLIFSPCNQSELFRTGLSSVSPHTPFLFGVCVCVYSRARNRSSSWPFPTSFPPSRLSTSLLFIQYKRSLWRIVRFSRSVCQPIVAQCLNPLYLHPSYKMDGSFLYWNPVFLPECHMSPIFVSARARLNTPLFLLDYNNQEGVLYSVRRKTSQALNAIDYKRRRCRPFEWRGISLWVSDVCLLLYRIKCWIPPPPFLFFFFLNRK